MSDSIRRSHRFTVTPEHLIRDPRISDRAFRLWCRLDRYAGSSDDGAAFPYRETLSVELDCSLASVDRALAELVDAGWLAKEGRPNDASVYTLLVVPEKALVKVIETSREGRRERWGQQRTRQRRATRSRQDTDADHTGVVTGDDTGVVTSEDTSVVTREDTVSSPVTTGVLTGDAQKEASLKEASLKETTSLRSVPATPPRTPEADLLLLLPSGPTPSKPAARKATRLPADWWPTPDLVEFARRESPGLDVDREAHRFRDYWTAKAGRDATKADWPATWRNWIRTAADRGSGGTRPVTTTTGSRPTDPWRRNLA